MHELNPPTYNYNVHTAALDSALKTALGAKSSGVSTYGPTRPISLWQDDSALPADDTNALSIAAAHDPVFLVTDKLNIIANNTDAATVVVTAPKPGAAAVTLLVNGNAVPVTLTNGIGTIQITSVDRQAIAITVQNPANRTTDQLTIQAV